MLNTELLKGTLLSPRIDREERKKYSQLIFLVTPNTKYSTPDTKHAINC